MILKYYKDSFLKYVEERGVNIVETLEPIDKVTIMQNEELAMKQLDAINFFHKAALGYDAIGHNIQNSTGKLVENYKIYNKKLKRIIETNYNDETLYKIIIGNKGTKYLKRGEKCISLIKELGYFNIIRRSMEKYEVCLGPTYYDNLRKSQGVKVKSLKDSCYNFWEIDAVSFLRKLKGKGCQFDWDGLIKYYCKIENLEEESRQFILAAISYPIEFMKCIDKYHRKKWSSEVLIDKLNKAIKMDGESLI